MMKKLMMIAILMLGVTAMAQEVTPKFEKLDNGLTQATYYHDNGTVAQTGTFLNKERHGEWISYNAEGTKTAEAKYDQDRKTGKWFFWKGDVLTEVDYSKNDIVAVNTWVNKSTVVTNTP
jgi:antitoxin component YwqK of YwqJK toxin-antitoxin module